MSRKSFLAVALAVLVAAAVPFVSTLPAGAAGAAPAAPAGATACVGGTAPFAAGGDLDQARQAMTCLVNEERARWGLPSVTTSALLDEAAELHGEWMADTQVFDHVETGPGALAQPHDRVTHAGYAFSFVGENLAAGPATPYDVVQRWLGSVGHCQNLRSPEPVHVGLYVTTAPIVYQGRTIAPVWTLVLGRPQGVAAPSADTTARAACLSAPAPAPGPAVVGSTTGKASKVKVEAVVAKRRVTLRITVRAARKPARGKVVVTTAEGIVRKARLSRRGQAKVTLKRQPKGKQAYTVIYLGNARTKWSQKTVKVKVR